MPRTIRTAWDQVERFRLKEKLARLIAWTKARSLRREVNASLVPARNQPAVPLDKAATERILDTIAAQAAAQGDETG